MSWRQENETIRLRLLLDELVEWADKNGLGHLPDCEVLTSQSAACTCGSDDLIARCREFLSV